MVEEFLNSKRYLHEVKTYGGNASVLADQFMRWFEGLWHGKSLAFTVACIATVISGGIFIMGYLNQSDLKGR